MFGIFWVTNSECTFNNEWRLKIFVWKFPWHCRICRFKHSIWKSDWVLTASWEKYCSLHRRIGNRSGRNATCLEYEKSRSIVWRVLTSLIWIELIDVMRLHFVPAVSVVTFNKSVLRYGKLPREIWGWGSEQTQIT